MSWESWMALKAALRRNQELEAALRAERAEHEGHHNHLRGTMSECSCGEQRGLVCVALTEEMYDPDWWVCGICGQRGVVEL